MGGEADYSVLRPSNGNDDEGIPDDEWEGNDDSPRTQDVEHLTQSLDEFRTISARGDTAGHAAAQAQAQADFDPLMLMTEGSSGSIEIEAFRALINSDLDDTTPAGHPSNEQSSSHPEQSPATVSHLL
jgi:hypothetical protein